MPLSTQLYSSILGLNLEGNIINPDSTPPNSTITAENISFFKFGRCITRKGHPEISPTLISSYLKDKKFISLFENGENTWFGTFIASDVSAYSGQIFKWTGSTPDANNQVASYSGIFTGGLRNADGTLATSSGYTPIFNNNFNYIPRFVNTGKNLYFVASNGLFEYRQKEPAIKFYKTPFPFCNISSASVNTTISASNKLEDLWFLIGYAVKISAVIRYYINDTQYIESPVSNEIEVKNVDGFGSITLSNLSAQVANIQDLKNCYVLIYRTIQYPFNNDPNNPIVPPTEKRLCYVEVMSGWTSAVSGTVQKITKSSISLTFNDDYILGRELIYTDSSAEGAVFEHMPPPAAKDIALAKQTTIYGGVVLPARGILTLTQQPTTVAVLPAVTTVGIELDSGTLTGTFTRQVNSLVEAYSLSAGGSYIGTSASSLGIQIRQVFTPSSTDNAYAVPAYARAEKIEVIMGTAGNNTATVKITPKLLTGSTGDPTFDLSKFSAPGVMAVVRNQSALAPSTNIPYVIDLIAFRDFESVPGSNTVDFLECFSVSNFSTDYITTTLTSPTSANDDPYIYFIPGTIINGTNLSALTDLPVYFSGSTVSTNSPWQYAGNSAFLSLLPTYKKYDTEEFYDKPAGIITKVTYDTGTKYLKAVVYFNGVTYRPTTALIEDCKKSFIDNLNAQCDYRYYAEPTGSIGEILIWKIPCGYNTSNALQETLNARIAAADTGKGIGFSEPITGTNYDIAEEVEIKNGIVLSKRNRPSAISIARGTSPVKIGDDNKWIHRIVVNNDIIYVFKEEEGIYRITIDDDPISPSVTSVTQVDNTLWCISPDTVFQLGGVIVFLSNRGAAMLFNNDIQIISEVIASQLLEEIAGVSQDSNLGATEIERLNKIRGFGNEQKQQWGIYFPTSGITYVYELKTKQWETWTIPFDCAAVRTTGQLTTIFKETYSTGGAWNEVRQDKQTGGTAYSTVDQYDEDWVLTNATISQTAASVSITRSGSTTIQTDLARLIERRNGRTFWLRNGTAMYELENVTTNSSTIAGTIKGYTNQVVDATWSLVLGVKATIQPNRYFSNGPVTLTRFSECQLQCPGVHTNVTIGFEADNDTPTFASSDFVTVSAQTDRIRVLVPQDQKRARWIMPKISHDTPKEIFNMSGIGWVVRDLDTFRTRR